MRLNPINSVTLHTGTICFTMCCKTLYLVFLLIVTVAVTEAGKNLTCYVCNVCPDASMLSKNATRSGCNWCEKQVINGIVNRLCAPKDCPNIPKGSGKYTYNCCQFNYCNECNHVYPTIVMWSLFFGFLCLIG
ncbi:hypothetical protein EG68_00768 [Paragonimus skrjabini miyazakii]|uniref:Uncharacterized protein n=1 Tax=Paragonimus skrjabini miyazakii TaxID=59628 RepID=A0A8S9Z8A2_9TREM|nr:hypothetical protein EG68_00768 [Paragonimus skrjabini miyazakii]